MLWGHPLGHTRSPALHARFSALTGIPLAYRADPVRPEDFLAHARGFFARGGWGANVTVPHKVAALSLAERLDPEAEACGAVNTLYRRDGEVRGANTDVIGLRREILARRGLGRSAPLRLVVVGAGGAARAVIAGLHEHCASIELLVRDAERGRALVRDLARLGMGATGLRVFGPGVFSPPLECTLLIDATSAWVRGERWSLPPESVARGAVFYTLTYGPEAKEFHDLADLLGASDCFDGWGLLVEQAAASFALWTGVFPPTESLREAGPEGLEGECNEHGRKARRLPP